LHAIMQLVTVELCASRSFGSAAALAATANIAAKAATKLKRITKPRMTPPPAQTASEHDSAMPR
jgi:hypothetical protein